MVNRANPVNRANLGRDFGMGRQGQPRVTEARGRPVPDFELSAQPVVVEDVVEQRLFLGTVFMGLYSGSVKHGLPWGPGSLSLPSNRGCLSGTFTTAIQDSSVVRVEQARLKFPNGDVLESQYIGNANGIFAVSEGLDVQYTYSNGDQSYSSWKDGWSKVEPLNLYKKLKQKEWETSPFRKLLEQFGLSNKISQNTAASELDEASILQAWGPEVETLKILEKLLSFSNRKNVDGNWNMQVNLLLGLTLLYGPARPYTSSDVNGNSYRYPVYSKHASQLDHITSTLFNSTGPLEINLRLSGKTGIKGPTAVKIQYHPEGEFAMRAKFKRINEDKTGLLLAAYKFDKSSGDAKLSTVDAVLSGAFSRGPCADGQITSMSEILINVGALESVASHIPDLQGRDVNQDVSAIAQKFHKECLFKARVSSSKTANLLDHEVEELDAFKKLHAAKHFLPYLRETNLGRNLSTEDLNKAVQWQVEVVGTLY